MTQRSVSRRGHATQEGFTIVEMLLVLSLTSLIAALITTSLMQLRPVLAFTSTTEVKNELAAASFYLESVVSRARQLVLIGETQGQRRTFVGATNNLNFVSVARTGAETSSLREVEIVAVEAGNGTNLVQRTQPRRLFSRAPSEEYIIVRDLTMARFEYLDKGDEGQSSRWRSDWSDIKTLPRAVRVTLAVNRLGRETKMEHLIVLAEH